MLNFWISYGRALGLMRRNDSAFELVQVAREHQEIDAHGVSILVAEIESVLQPTEAELNAASALFSQAKFDELIDLCNILSRRYPRNALSWKYLGSAYQCLGRFQEAIEALDHAIQLNELDAECLINRGIAFRDHGDLAEAMTDCHRAMTIAPSDARVAAFRGEVAGLLGLQDECMRSWIIACIVEPCSAPFECALAESCRALGQSDQAASRSLKATCIDPGHSLSLMLHGLSNRDVGNSELALRWLAKSAAADPENFRSLCYTGTILTENGMYDASFQSFSCALSLAPSDPETLNNFALLSHRANRLSDALDQITRAMRAAPDVPELLNTYGVVLQSLERFSDSIEYYSRAIALKPSHANAANNLGSVYWRLDNPDAALRYFDVAVNVEPKYAEALHNKAKALHEMQRLNDAIACYDQLIANNSRHAEAYWHKSLALLALGDYRAGWNLYEFRWLSEQNIHIGERGPDSTMWRGESLASNTRLLVYHEQGLGDTIQFCRYLRLLAAHHKNILACVPDSLARLLRGQGGFGDVRGLSAPVPAFDLHVPLMSMPLLTGTTLDNIPFSGGAYLKALPDDVSVWRRRLDQFSAESGNVQRTLMVGLVWSGGEHSQNLTFRRVNRRRNVSLEMIASRLDIAGITFVSLQKGEPAESLLRDRETQYWNAGRIFNASRYLSDFADTAGLIANLDVIVSVDTSTAHLSAAMGKPTWILNRYDSCWRWLSDREDSPWYRSVKLYRQGSDRDWTPVLDRVAEDLRRASSALALGGRGVQ